MWLDDPILNSMSEGTSESNKVNLPYSPWAPKKKIGGIFTKFIYFYVLKMF